MAMEYADSFSIHGLTKAFNGKPKEKFLWTLTVILGLAVSLFVVSRLIIKYTKNEIYLETETVITQNNTFPAVTICARRDKNFFCGLPVYDRMRGGSCVWKKKYPDMSWGMQSFSGSVWKWSNNAFDVEIDERDSGTNNVQSLVMKGVFSTLNSSRGDCIVFNKNGKYFNVKNKFVFSVKPKPKFNNNLELIIHEPGVYSLHKDTGAIELTRDVNYQFILKKTKIKRLENPYPSNCSSNKELDMFPGKYSLLGCQQTMLCMKHLRQLGVTYDFCRDWIDQDILEKYQSDHLIEKATTLLYDTLEDFGAEQQKCQAACEETGYSVSTSTYGKNSPNGFFKISLEYEHPNTYTSITERELYSWDQMLGEAGGFTGLMVGMSVLSIVEIIIFSCLKILHGLSKIKK